MTDLSASNDVSMTFQGCIEEWNSEFPHSYISSSFCLPVINFSYTANSVILILLLKPRELQSVSRLTARAASLSLRLSFFQITLSISATFKDFKFSSIFHYDVSKSFPELNEIRRFLCWAIIARDKPHSKQHSNHTQLNTIIGSYGPGDDNNILRRFSGATDSDSWLRLKWADFSICIRCSTPNSAAEFERS